MSHWTKGVYQPTEGNNTALKPSTDRGKKGWTQHEDANAFMSTCLNANAADSVSDLWLSQNANPMRPTVVGTVSPPVVLSRPVQTFLALLCAFGRAAEIRRPADRQMFIHLPVSPPASAPHSSGSVKLSESHRGFIIYQSLIIHTQFTVSSGGEWMKVPQKC